MSTLMVQALLDNRKSMTRRVVKPQPKNGITIGNVSINGVTEEHFLCDSDGDEIPDTILKCPYGQIGDRLWVRETWATTKEWEDKNHKATSEVMYKATFDNADMKLFNSMGIKWKPSIFMPRHASRITLEITNIKVEKLQEITHDDAVLEGCYYNFHLSKKVSLRLHPKVIDTATVHCFANLWDSINLKRGYGWSVNPWVWCISFRRI